MSSGFGTDKELSYSVNLDLQGAEQELRSFQQRILMDQQVNNMAAGAPPGGGSGLLNDPIYGQIARVFELQSSKSATERAVTEYLQQAGGATPYGFTRTERFVASALPAAMGAVAAGVGALALGPVAPILGLGAMVGGSAGYFAGNALGSGIPEALTTHLATRHLLREDELAGRIRPMTASERSDVATGIRRAADFYDVDMEAALRMYNQASDSSSVFKNKSPEEFKENAVKLIRQWKSVSLIMYDSLEEAGRAVEEMERRKLLTRDPTQMAQLVSMARMASTLTGTPINQVLDATQGLTQQFSYGTSQAPGDVARGLLPYYTQWMETYQGMDPRQKELVKNIGGPDVLFGAYSAAARNYLANTPEGAAVLYAQTMASKTGQDLVGGLRTLGPAMQTMTPYELMTFQGEAAERFAEMQPGEQARTIVNAARTFIDSSVAPRTQDAVALFLTRKMGMSYANAKATAAMLTPMATEEGRYQDFWMNVKASGLARHAAEAVDNNAEGVANWMRRTFGATGPLGEMTAWATDLIMPDETSFTWKTQHGTSKAEAFDDLSRRVFGDGGGSISGPLAGVRGAQHALSAMEQFSELMIKGEASEDSVVQSVLRELDAQDVPPEILQRAEADVRRIMQLRSPQERQQEVSKLLRSYSATAADAKRQAYLADDARVVEDNKGVTAALAGYRRTRSPSPAATLAFQRRLATDETLPSGIQDVARAMEKRLATGTDLDKASIGTFSRGLAQRTAQEDPMDYLRDTMRSSLMLASTDVPGTPGFGGVSETFIRDLLTSSANDPQLEAQRNILQRALSRHDGTGKIQFTGEERAAMELLHKGTRASNVYELSGADKAKAAQFAGALEANRGLFAKDASLAVDKVVESMKASGMYSQEELQQRRGVLAELHVSALRSDDYDKAMQTGLDAMVEGARTQSDTKRQAAGDAALSAILDGAYERNAVGGGRGGNTPMHRSAVNDMGRAMDLFRKLGTADRLPQMLKEIDRKLQNPDLKEDAKARLTNMKTVLENLPGMTPEQREAAMQQVAGTLVMDVDTKTRDDILRAKFGSAYDKNKAGIEALGLVGAAARRSGSDLPDVLEAYNRQAQSGAAGSKLLTARGVEDFEVEYGGTTYKVDLEDVNFGDREAVMDYVKKHGYKGLFQRDRVVTSDDERKFTDKLMAAHKARVQSELSTPDMQEAMKRAGLSFEDYVRDPETFLQSIGRVEKDKNPVRDYGNAAAGLSAQLDEHAKLMGKLTDTIVAENGMMRQATSGRTAR